MTDIGFGSAEILTLYAGRPSNVASSSIGDLSLETLANRIAMQLQKQTGRIVRGVDLMRLLQQGKNTVIISGESLDIGPIKKFYIEQIAKTLTDEIVAGGGYARSPPIRKYAQTAPSSPATAKNAHATLCRHPAASKPPMGMVAMPCTMHASCSSGVRPSRAAPSLGWCLVLAAAASRPREREQDGSINRSAACKK